MPRYSIHPADGNFPSATIIATDPRQVLELVGRLPLEEADVHEDGAYSYSLRLDGSGIWYIFHRESKQELESVSPVL